MKQMLCLLSVIQKLFAEDTNLTVFQERKVNIALIDKDAIYSAEGGGTVTTVNQVIGAITPVPGGVGGDGEGAVAAGRGNAADGRGDGEGKFNSSLGDGVGAGEIASGDGDGGGAGLGGGVGGHRIGEGLVAVLGGAFVAGKPGGTAAPVPAAVGGDNEGAVAAGGRNGAGSLVDRQGEFCSRLGDGVVEDPG